MFRLSLLSSSSVLVHHFLTHFLCNVMVNLTNHNVRFSDDKSTIYCKKNNMSTSFSTKTDSVVGGNFYLSSKNTFSNTEQNTHEMIFAYIYF